MGRVRHSLFLGCLAVLTLAVSVTASEARKMRLHGFIPGVGPRDSLVKVVDLPDRAPFMKDGKFIDLGYRFKVYGGGEWIGYIGSSSRYLPLKPGGAEMLALAAGLKKLPPVPQRPAGSMFWMVMFGIGVLVIGKGLLNKIAGFGGERKRPAFQDGAPADGSAAAQSDWKQKAEQAAAQQALARQAPVQRAAKARQPTVTRVGSGFGQRAAFGQR